MNKEVSIVMVGLSGYGHSYLGSLLDNPLDPDIRIAGAVDPVPDRSNFYQRLIDAKVPIYNNLEEFYAKDNADLAILSTPIHTHEPLTCLALENGSNVLCEKPLCATVQEADKMLEAEKAADGLFVAVGYQWSFTNSVQGLKKDILAGNLGEPERFKTLVMWPRDSVYFGRSSWAGAMKGPNGEWILDSPVNNATAHYLHNMLYVLGPDLTTSATPKIITGELYRANQIENFDTAAMRCVTTNNVELLFLSTHAVSVRLGPVFHYEFSEADVYFHYDNIIASFHNGERRSYGNPSEPGNTKLWQCINSVRDGSKPLCGIEGAKAQTLCVNALQESMPEIAHFPQELINTQSNPRGGEITWINGLADVLVQCYELGMLPSDYGGVSWAKSGKTLDLGDYKHFPSKDGLIG